MKRKQRIVHESAEKDEPLVLQRIIQIDLLKGLAILSVILIHCWNPAMRRDLLAPFYIEQAVPLFILIAGYTSAYAFVRYGSNSLGACYDKKVIFRRMRRILEPYTLMWVVQIILIVIILQQNIDFFTLITNFFCGGNGPGSYFVPIIVQHIFVVPILFLLVLRNARVMLLAAFCVNFGYLALAQTLHFQQFASLIYAQFIFAGALGVYYALTPRPALPVITTSAVIGFFSIYLETYTNFLLTQSIFPLLGCVIHVLTYLWVFVLALAVMFLIPIKKIPFGFRWLEYIGKASWHIFLIQMSMFFFLSGFIDQVLVPMINSTIFPYKIIILFGHALVMVILCCSLGCLWFWAGKVFNIRLKSQLPPLQ